MIGDLASGLASASYDANKQRNEKDIAKAAVTSSERFTQRIAPCVMIGTTTWCGVRAKWG